MRLFFAAELSVQLKTTLLTLQDRFEDVIGQPVAGDNFHLTLAFLGQTSDNQFETIVSGLPPLPVAPFSIQLNGFDYWPKPKVLTCHVSEPHAELVDLKRKLDKALGQLGINHYQKKKYQPHITLFRHVELPPLKMPSFSDSFTVDSFSLMASRPSRSGVIYESLEHWPLAKGSVRQQLVGR